MDERADRDSIGKRVKIFAGLAVAAFAVTLAVVVGNRLSDEALAVLAGTVCGVGAAIPTSLLVVSASRRRDDQRASGVYPQPPAPSQGVYPPVIVVTPPSNQQRPGDWNMLPPSLAAPAPRQFTVVGGSPVDAEVRYEHYSGSETRF